MNIFCPRCGGYTPPRVAYCRVCGGKVQLLREQMGDILAAPVKLAAGAMPKGILAVGEPPPKAAPKPAKAAPPPVQMQAAASELDLGMPSSGGSDLGASGPLAGLGSLGGGSSGLDALGSLGGGDFSANPFGGGGGLGDDLGGLNSLGGGLGGGDFGGGGLDGLGSLGGNLTGGFNTNAGGGGGGLGDLEKLSFGDLGGGGPLSLDDKGGLDGDLGAFSSVNPPFDLGGSSGPANSLENLDLSIAPGATKSNAGSLFNLDAPSGDFGNLGDFTVSGGGKVDFGDLGGGNKSSGGKGLFDLDALSASNPSTGLGSLPSAPEPEIDFSLLSNPDKKKVLKSLEDLDFSKSDLSGSGASKLLDGDLDFTGLSSPAAFKGSEDNLYNMDEMPSLGGGKGPSDDPFATLLNQPARPRGQAPSLINPNDVAEVEKELNKVSAQPAAPAVAAGVPLQLVVYTGTKAVKKFALRDGENTIGQRDDLANINPDIDLADWDAVGLVAPMHCKVYKEGDRYTLSDELGSTGTQLNNKPLVKTQRTPIKAGDSITLAGNLTLKLEP